MLTLDFQGKSFSYTQLLGAPYRGLLVVSEKSCVPEGQQADIHENLEALKALPPGCAAN
jgi:hypothetical protein